MSVNLKNCFPFRLGTTSFIKPADIIPNVEHLAERVDDVQLLLLESDNDLDLPDKETIDQLNILADKHSLSYSIHLPLDARFGSTDENIRKSVVNKCLKAISASEPLNPLSYVMHFHGDNNDHRSNPPTEDIQTWKSNIERSIKEILNTGINPRMICIETLFYPFELIDDIIFKYDLSVCLDIGHVMLGNGPAEKYIDRYMSRTPVLHIHGIKDEKDHRDISYFDKDILDLLISKLKNDQSQTRVLTLEVFNENDFEASMKIMEQYK